MNGATATAMTARRGSRSIMIASISASDTAAKIVGISACVDQDRHARRILGHAPEHVTRRGAPPASLREVRHPDEELGGDVVRQALAVAHRRQAGGQVRRRCDDEQDDRREDGDVQQLLLVRHGTHGSERVHHGRRQRLAEEDVVDEDLHRPGQQERDDHLRPGRREHGEETRPAPDRVSQHPPRAPERRAPDGPAGEDPHAGIRRMPEERVPAPHRRRGTGRGGGRRRGRRRR